MSRREKGELTDRQQEFARLVVMGCNKSEAYRRAYNKPKCSAAAASKAADRLSKNEGILAFMGKLREERDASAVLSRQERMERLSRMALDAQEVGAVQAAVACIKELNKMDGAYEPEKVEVSGALGVGAVVAALQGRDLELHG